MAINIKNKLPTEPSNVNTSYNNGTTVNQTVPSTVVSDTQADQKMANSVDKGLQGNLAKVDYFGYNGPKTTTPKNNTSVGSAVSFKKTPEQIQQEKFQNEFKNSNSEFKTALDKSLTVSPIETKKDTISPITGKVETPQYQFQDKTGKPFDVSGKSEQQIQEMIDSGELQQEKLKDSTSKDYIDTQFGKMYFNQNKEISVTDNKDFIDNAIKQGIPQEQAIQMLEEAQLNNQTSNLKTDIKKENLINDKVSSLEQVEDIKSYFKDPLQAQQISDEYNSLKQQYDTLSKKALTGTDEYGNKLDERQIAIANAGLSGLQKQLSTFLTDKFKTVELSDIGKAKTGILDSEAQLEQIQKQRERENQDFNTNIDLKKVQYEDEIKKLKDSIGDNIFGAGTITSKDGVNYLGKKLQEGLDKAKFNYETADKQLRLEHSRNLEDLDTNIKNIKAKQEANKDSIGKEVLSKLSILTGSVSMSSKAFSNNIKNLNNEYKMNMVGVIKDTMDAYTSSVEAFNAQENQLINQKAKNSQVYNENLQVSLKNINNMDILSANQMYNDGMIGEGQYKQLLGSIKSETYNQLKDTGAINDSDIKVMNNSLNNGDTVAEAVANTVMASKGRLKFPKTEAQLKEQDYNLQQQKIEQDISNEAWNRKMDIANYNIKANEANKRDTTTIETKTGITTVDKNTGELINTIPISGTETKQSGYIKKDGTSFDTTGKTESQIKSMLDKGMIKKTEGTTVDLQKNPIVKGLVMKALNGKMTNNDIEKAIPNSGVTIDQINDLAYNMQQGTIDYFKDKLSKDKAEKFDFITTTSNDFNNQNFKKMDLETLNNIPYTGNVKGYVNDNGEMNVGMNLTDIDKDSVNLFSNVKTAKTNLNELQGYYKELNNIDPKLFGEKGGIVAESIRNYIKDSIDGKDVSNYTDIIKKSINKFIGKTLFSKGDTAKFDKIYSTISKIQSIIPRIVTPLGRSFGETGAFTDSDYKNYLQTIGNFNMNYDSVNKSVNSLIDFMETKKGDQLNSLANKNVNVNDYADYFMQKNAEKNKGSVLAGGIGNVGKNQNNIVNKTNNTNTSKNQNPFAKKNTQVNTNTQQNKDSWDISDLYK